VGGGSRAEVVLSSDSTIGSGDGDGGHVPLPPPPLLLLLPLPRRGRRGEEEGRRVGEEKNKGNED